MWTKDPGDADDRAPLITDPNGGGNGHCVADSIHAYAHCHADQRAYDESNGGLRDAHGLDVTDRPLHDAARG
jgi:hypothetical protein